MESTRGASPESAPAAPSPAAAPAAASSLPAPDFVSKVKAASNPKAVQDLVREMLRPGPAPTPAPAATAASAPVPAEGNPAEPAPTPEVTPETPAAPEVPDPEAPAPETPAEPEPETPDDGETPIVPSDKTRLRIRLKEDDQVGRLAAAYQQRNRDWSLKQAMDAAEKQLGIAPAAPAPTPAAPDPTKPQLPQTVEAVDAEIDRLFAEKKTAIIGMDFEKQAELDEKISKLGRHRGTVERQSQQAAQQQVVKYNQDFDTSEAKANELYEFMKVPTSPAHRRMMEIDAALQETGDALYHSPDKPLKIAQMVAAEMNIPPRSKKPAQPAKPAPAPSTAKPKSVLPAGSNGTTPALVNQPPPIQAEIRAATTVLALRKLGQKLGMPNLA